MKICEKCGRPGFDPKDEFCYADGTKLLEQRIHGCGRPVTANDKFCPRCGVDLVAEEKESRDSWMDERLREEIMQDREQ